MQRIIIITLVLLMTGSAWAVTDISVGVYGGLNQPVAQEDARSGGGFGIKAKVSPIPFLAGAVFYESRTYRKAEITEMNTTMTSDGGKVTVFGLEALVGSAGGGSGPHFYWSLGVESYKWKRDIYPDLNKVGYSLGPGLEIELPANIGVEARAKFEIVPTGGGGSRKNALVFVGANYHFGIM